MTVFLILQKILSKETDLDKLIFYSKEESNIFMLSITQLKLVLEPRMHMGSNVNVTNKDKCVWHNYITCTCIVTCNTERLRIIHLYV